MIKQTKNNAGFGIIKLLLLCVLLTLIMLSILFAMQEERRTSFQWDQLNPIQWFRTAADEEQKKTNVISTGDFSLSSVKIQDNHLLVLSDGDIRLIDVRGEEVWYIPHEIRKPVMAVYDDRVLVYEQNGKSFLLIKNGKVLFRQTLEEEIMFGEVTENLILFINSNSNGYKATVRALSTENGIQLGVLFIEDYYPFYASINSAGGKNEFILCGLGLNSVRLSTIIRKYDSSFIAAPMAGIELDGLYPVMLDNDRRLMFAGEKGVYCYSHDWDMLWSESVTDSITAAGLFDGGEAVVALNGNSKSIAFYDSTGRKKKVIDTDESVTDIVTFKNMAAIIAGSEASFYSSQGSLIDKVHISGLSVKVHFINEKKAYLISEHEIVVHQISSKNLYQESDREVGY